MALGLQMMLSALGVKIDDATVRQIETILPQLPGYLLKLTEHINTTIRAMDERFKSLEQSHAEQRQLLLEIKAQLGELLNGRTVTDHSNGGRKRVTGTRTN